MCLSAVMSAIRPTAWRAASTETTKSTGMTACMPTPSGSGQAAAPLKAIVAAVSSQAVWRSSGNGMRSQVSSRSSASRTQMPASMPIGKTSEKSPKPFWRASSRTAAYDPANPIAAMSTAPATTRPMSIRWVRVSCIAATRVPSPFPVSDVMFWRRAVTSGGHSLAHGGVGHCAGRGEARCSGEHRAS